MINKQEEIHKNVTCKIDHKKACKNEGKTQYIRPHKISFDLIESLRLISSGSPLGLSWKDLAIYAMGPPVI